VSRAKGSESARFWWRLKGLRDQRGDIGRFRVGNIGWQMATDSLSKSVILALGTRYLGWLKSMLGSSLFKEKGKHVVHGVKVELERRVENKMPISWTDIEETR
jgi:hypothetical protein